MKLIILGKTNDEKGKQLETLSKTLFEKIGYVNLVTNVIGSGGHEIDISADLPIPTLTLNQFNRVICECKAHKEPVNTTDWLKFLGKVYIEEAKLGKTVSGCFIALSGANGNVMGSYDDLRNNKGKNNIELVSGDSLSKLLTNIYQLPNAEGIIEGIKGFTDRQMTSISLAYYENNVFWLIEFDDNYFTLIQGNGIAIASSEKKLIKLVEKTTASGKFFALSEEHAAQIKKEFDEKIVLGCLMLIGGEGNTEAINEKRLELIKKHPKSKIDQVEIIDAIERLKTYKFIKTINNKHKIFYTDDIEYIIDFYNFIVNNNGIFVPYLGCPIYDKYIDERLLDEIIRIQERLEIPIEYRKSCIQILKWSPHALSASINPILGLVPYPEEKWIKNLGMEDFMFEMFFQSIYELLIKDFQVSQFSEYFLETRGIIEIDINSDIKVKSYSKLLDEIRHRKRLRLAKSDDPQLGNFVILTLRNDATEPWERGNTMEQTKIE